MRRAQTTQGSAEERLERAAGLEPAARREVVRQVVLDHLPLAKSLALRYRDRGEAVDDLVQVAYLGLVKAAYGYRAGLGHSFGAYAVPTVKGELRKHFRDSGWAVRPPRRLQELRANMRRAEEQLRQRLGRSVRPDELADTLSVDVLDILEARRAGGGYSAISLDAPPSGEGTTSTWADLLPDEGAPVDAVVSIVALRQLLAALPPRDQRILAMRFYQGCTQQQIAEAIGVTQMQVSRLLAQVLRRLRAELAGPQTLAQGA